MNITRLSRAIIPFNHQVRYFVRDPFPNKLTHYLRRAELINSIRLVLRSNNPNSLQIIINTRLLDTFVVTQALRSAPNADAALSFVDSLKKIDNTAHLSRHQSTLHALATVLARWQRGLELKALIGEINEGKYGNVRFSFMNLMQWYAATGDLEAVLDVWKQYRNGDKRVCTESYNIVMSLYAQKGRDCEAVRVFYRMIHEGAIPNSRTYTVMIEHLVNSGKLDPAIEIFSVLPLMRIKRTLKQYLVLVEGFVGLERFDGVRTLLDEMRADGKFPGRAMRKALHCLRGAGFVEETEDFLKEMFPDERIKSISTCRDISFGEDADEDEDEETDEDENHGGAFADIQEVRLKPWLDPRALAKALNKWSPDVVSALQDAKFVWTTRLVWKVLRNINSPETAWDFFCWVAYQPGFTHDVYTVQRMMTLLAKHGKVELVDQLITKIRSEGMRLPFSTIRLIIDFCGISKNADAALKVFREDRALCGPITKYNLMLLYSSLIRTLTKCKRDSDAIDVLEEMILCGICPDIQTFSGLMYHFASQGDIKTVQKLLTIVRQSDVEPDAYMYKVLIQAYCKCDRAALAWRIFEDMKNSNLIPDVATKDLLVKSLWKEGKLKEAATVEESCDGINSVLPLKQHGHKWTLSSADLAKVYNLYSNSFKLSNGH
ncbi:PREDICTED: pentatricopeptide repeat-containing protein At5g66631-like [Populus euphratica]|uniref:Pentatricopeptide repeat-containing protein At5g66631-like n=1 Tax=Populus euphratica TaxID=75702 RepID=A0AAJ6X941_POPEU|nr:PREDICTED: pentatricopeptide repeat-containing protein At5g66631-like [Populus euphratica]